MAFNESNIERLLSQGESAGVFHKAVAGFILPDGTTRTVALNTPADTVFDIASLTKVCPTSTLALCYILEGKLHLDDRVINYIPELQTNYREDIRVFHLLTHSLDYRVPMKTLRTLPPEGILNALFTYKFAKAPGADFNYGNPASVLLGIILQRLTGKDLQQQGRERFFEPLGMTRSGWDPLTREWNAIPRKEIAPTEICEFRGREICGEIHDESAWVLRKLFPVGSAGMFSCVPDLLKFVKMVMNDGIAAGANGSEIRVAPADILKMVSENAFIREGAAQFLPAGNSTSGDSTAGDSPAGAANGACTALGWELAQGKFMGSRVSPHAFGKTGFTGASIVADPIAGAAVVLLSDFTYPHREANADRIHAFRASLADAFFGAV
ncbi:CubicO group peptidase, beta-lactamase class C family [Fibrobacter sp. UWT3]|uniref:serine hydrolase domain-containing protein n=1 Tax=Fibrobacter sp. UWT3 TaxID=1896225 RepID=UPI000BC4D75D|nr:serine hydrolase domain-containing protein [Fibrobacter sp. UWT3]SOE76176.1 CubicO group peptidase, beta-lactamase class C family [Fibrobacter sp. UWT3]